MMKFADHLESAGWDKGVDEFEDLMDSTFNNLVPGASVDALLCNPPMALHYCDALRKRSGLSLPDEVICTKLMNMRKGGEFPVRKPAPKRKRKKN